MPEAAPLAEAEGAGPVEQGDGEKDAPLAEATPASQPRPPFKVSTFVLAFLFSLGIVMIIFPDERTQVAGAVIGPLLWPLLGFSGNYPMLTMCIAAILEMAATAVAYNWATDWVKAARVQKWSAAFRKVQLAALKSGKKDRVESLQEHQQTLTRLSSEVSIAQLKGMAVTWFLVIAIYTWVWLFLDGWSGHHAAANVVSVQLAGSTLGLTQNLWIVPAWFLIFTFYTVPFSLLFRRILKHVTLRRYAERRTTPGVGAPSSGGAS